MNLGRLESPRLVLEPLRRAHADELAPVLDDAGLHRFTGGRPLSLEELRRRFARLERGRSPDGRALWLNWVVRERRSGIVLGTVQATVRDGVADLAWVIGSRHQGQGVAKEAAALMASWLRAQGVGTLRAHIHPDHAASMAVARSIGLAPTSTCVEGERRWESGSVERGGELAPG